MKNNKASVTPITAPAAKAKADAAVPAAKLNTGGAKPAAKAKTDPTTPTTVAQKVKVAPKAVDTPRETEVVRKPETGKAAVGDATAAPRNPEPRSAPLGADMSRLNREGVETVFEVVSAFARCCETLGSEWARYARTSFNEGAAVSKALLCCTSVEEAVAIQSDFVKGSVDRYLDESTRLSEISVLMTNQALAPLNNRISGVSQP